MSCVKERGDTKLDQWQPKFIVEFSNVVIVLPNSPMDLDGHWIIVYQDHNQNLIFSFRLPLLVLFVIWSLENIEFL